MLNVLMPIAGGGRRFKEAGYKKPKPLVEVDGVPMFYCVIANMSLPSDSKLILICMEQLLIEYRNEIEHFCRARFKEFEIITVSELTEGAACTVLTAEKLIDNNEELLIGNCDQLVLQPNYMKNALTFWRKYRADGGILCFYADEPCWSFVNMDRKGWVRCVVEKQVVSNFATVGIYYYKRGSDFVRYAKRMIACDDRVNDEFYVAPVYNHFLQDRELAKILPYLVNDMYGLGTPEQLKHYERSR